MEQNRERLYINVVKGLAIVLMIWGHCIQFCAKDSFNVFSNSVFRFIYSFHMPLFMLISGYLFSFSYRKRDLKSLLVHRTQGMLQPIFFASILNSFLAQIPTFILHGTIHLTNGELFNGIYSLWFLWCVLSSSTAVSVAGKTARNPWMQLLLVILGIFFVSLFPENHYHIYMYPYFVAGFYYGSYRGKIPAWISGCAILSLLVFPVILPYYRTRHFIYMTPIYTPDKEISELIRVNLFRWFIGFAGSLFVLTIVRIAFRFLDGRKSGSFVLKGLGRLGENSLAIYCLSLPLLSNYLSKFYDRFLLYAGRNVFAENMTVYNFVFTPILTVCYCFGLYYVVLFMKKIKIHNFIFGR